MKTPGQALDYPRVSAAFTRARRKAAERFSLVATVSWYPTWAAGDRGRAYGFCSTHLPIGVGLSPRLEEQADDRIAGIIRHELGHAIDGLYSRDFIESILESGQSPASKELLADWIAERVFDEGPLCYDEEAVQSTAFGVPHRPAWLPK